jgi:hypothetical protein
LHWQAKQERDTVIGTGCSEPHQGQRPQSGYITGRRHDRTLRNKLTKSKPTPCQKGAVQTCQCIQLAPNGLIEFPKHPLTIPTLTKQAAYPFNSRAISNAKYVSIPSAPARLKAIRLSGMTFLRSSQPRSMAAISIAYSPDTW